MRVKLAVVATVLLAIGSLSACGTPVAKDCTAVGVSCTQAEGPPAVPGAAPTGSNRPAATSEPAPTESDDGVVAFDSERIYSDGLSVTVSKGKTFTPSQYAAGTEGFKSFVKYTVVIVNGTGKVFDPSSFTASVQSSNVEGSQVFDDHMDGGPSTKLLKGREAKFVIGFGVQDPKDVVLQVTPSFEHSVMLLH